MYIMHAYQRGVPLPYRGFQQEEFIDKFMSKQNFYRIILKDLFSSASEVVYKRVRFKEL